MTQECKLAAEIVDRIIVGTGQWSELFKKHDFFYKYKYYLQIIASSGSADLQLKWHGTVESKLRQLVMKLELVPTLVCAHPYTKGFEQISECHSDEELRQVATGDIPEEVAKRTKMEALSKQDEATVKEQDEAAQQQAAKEGHRMIWTTTFFIGLQVEPRSASAPPGAPRRLDISYPTTEFTRMVKQWEQFDDSSMGIVVRHIKCSQLPEYVFEGDEKPVAKPLKRAKNGKAKRGEGVAESNDGTTPAKKKSKTNGAGTGAEQSAESAPVLPLQSDTAQTELENFKLATGGAVPAASSADARDFAPPAA